VQGRGTLLKNSGERCKLVEMAYLVELWPLAISIFER